MTLLNQISQDLGTFIDTDAGFASSVSWKKGLVPTTIDAIFDDASTVINMQTGEIETTKPQVVVKTSDVPGISYADTITVGSVEYKVHGIQPDGTGLTVLILTKK